MRYQFADCELDTARHEFRAGRETIKLEPQVFDLLVLLARHPGRLISRDELIAEIWGGRIVSESAISARINAARKAVGDDGERQVVIATVPRRGIKLVAAVTTLADAASVAAEPPATQREQSSPPEPEPPALALAPRRASIGVMPFAETSVISEASGGTGRALAYDVIVRLSKLRTHTVMAQGTMITLHERGVSAEEAGRILGVDYVVGGTLRRRGDRMTVMVELITAQSGHLVWAETYEPRSADTFALLEEIGNRIVSSIAVEIETTERNRAILKPPSSLDAWEAYHRGLWHMYRFTQADNEQAKRFFEVAARLDPTFSRAHAGLSFTHWQDSFQGWTPEHQRSLEAAYAAASEGLMADDRDPAAHWAMGRAQWLRGRHDQSVVEFEQAVDLSPNFALAHYNLAFVHSTAGDANAAIVYSDHSRNLSPFDPMLFGMLGARAMALARLRRFDEAADWGVKAASRPNAFSHIRAIASFSLALADRHEEARSHLALLHEAIPGYSFANFQRAFRFDATGTELFRKGAKLLGVE